MRLTKKTQYGYENESCEITECSDKLGQLEDIEEELGIDLIILLKALIQGVWYKEENVVHKCKVGFITKTVIALLDDELPYLDCCYPVEIKEYGKTWALTKEELE